MSSGELEKIRGIKVPNIKMVVTLKEALEILKERTFQLGDMEIFNLVDRIYEHLYPSDPD
jgi:hypothetical protein